MQPVPNELLDCVVDNLCSDIPSLLSCALVGKAWVPSSQRCIFREIVLRLPPTPYINQLEDLTIQEGRDAYLDTTRKLIASFNSTPHLSSYVQLLELQQIFNRDGIQDVLHDATANIIQRLPNVKCLKLTGSKWADASPTLRVALVQLFRAISLTEVTLSGLYNTSFAEVTSLLNHMPRQLEVLHLVPILLSHTQGYEEMEEIDQPPRSIQLKRLTMHSCVDQLFDWFREDSCPFEIRNLQSLHIGDFEGWDVHRQLRYVGNHLTELELLFSPEPTVYSDCLTYTPNLRILHLCGLDQTDSSSPVPMIHTMFKALLNPDGEKFPLRHLTIGLNVYLSSPLQTDHWDEWAEVDRLFSKPEFALLEKVDVTLSSLIAGEPLLNDVVALLSERFQFLAEEGKLTAQCNQIH